MKIGLFVSAFCLISFRLIILKNLDLVIACAIGLSICWFFIFKSRFLAETILPFGFWESFASDRKTPENSSPAIAFLGWFFLLGLVVIVFNFSPSPPS